MSGSHPRLGLRPMGTGSVAKINCSYTRSMTTTPFMRLAANGVRRANKNFL
ncbi:unnamed protein product [Nesidiocoris tenuis]|uniref:Uncharacterized protein n=1 Tax=Nesidiocoris tenuis TaxID=355587 RepID=A0A6H5GVJ0_9HEMI|nr:unnamed protein product [Nesidiocoris tenuis]